MAGLAGLAPRPSQSSDHEAAATGGTLEDITEQKPVALPLTTKAAPPRPPRARAPPPSAAPPVDFTSLERSWILSLKGGAALLIHLADAGAPDLPRCHRRRRGVAADQPRYHLKAPIVSGGNLGEARAYSNRLCCDCVKTLAAATQSEVWAAWRAC